MIKLNIGCGKDTMEGYINLDLIKGEGVDVTHDLEVFPYPFEDNKFSEIIGKHIIEHLTNPEEFASELWRMTKKNGKIILRTPHFSCGSLSWGDLTHKRSFSTLAFYNYDINNKKLNLNTLASEHKMLFEVKCKIIFGKIHKKLGLEKLFNRFQEAYESFFYGFFPAREIEYELKVIKEDLE